MVQKAQRIPTKTDRLIQNRQSIRDLYALSRLRIVPKTIQLPSFGTGAAGGDTIVGSGDFLKTKGDVMIGPIAFNPVLVSIVDGRINISPGSANPPDYSTYVLATGSGSPDDLDFIDGGAFNGQYLILQGTNQQVINIRNGLLMNIVNIVGTGIDNIITVTVGSTTGLISGDKVNIVGTSNFDINGATITVTGGTTFTYDLGSIGSTTAETTGQIQRGNILTADGNTITLNGTSSLAGIPSITFIFDVTAGSGGAWRPIGAAAGEGGIIINNVLTTTNPSGAINVDVSAHQHFVFDLNANITITFTGLPSINETSEQIVLEFIQDVVGTRTVGYSQTIAPSVPAIDTTAGAREVVTGFIRRDAVGAFVFNLYLVGN